MKLHIITDINDPVLRLIGSDPVRPEIPWEFRVQEGFSQIFVNLDSSKDYVKVSSVLCCLFRPTLASSRQDLLTVHHHDHRVAVYYSLWSADYGTAGPLISAANAWIREHKPTVSQIVSFSPFGENIEQFHSRKGASFLSINGNSINYSLLSV